MRRVASPLLLTACIVLCAGCGSTRPPVPLSVQRAIEKENPGQAYFPTRLPRGYHYDSWGHHVGLYDISFVRTNSHGRVLSGITFSVSPTPYVAPGLDGADPNQAFQINRHTEYWIAGRTNISAWRWVWNHGRSIKITAANDSAHTDAEFVAYAELAK